jgi:hypothetical protein
VHQNNLRFTKEAFTRQEFVLSSLELNHGMLAGTYGFVVENMLWQVPGRTEAVGLWWV